MLYVLCKTEIINFGASLAAVFPMLERFHIPLGVGEGAFRLMPETVKRMFVSSAVERNKARILEILQKSATENNIKVILRDIKIIQREGNIFEIGIEVGDLDYGSVAEAVLPMFNKLLSNLLSGNPKLQCILNELPKEPQVVRNIVYAVLDVIPEETKNNMVSSAVECYQEEILKALNNVLQSKGIAADISEIKVRNNSL